MKTKIKVLATLFMIVIAINSIAQPEQGQRPSVEERTTKTLNIIEKQIEVDDSQKQVISDAFTSFFEKVDELVQPGQQPKKEIIEEQEKVRDDKIKGILTTEQYEDYLRLSCRLRPNPNKQHRGQRPPKRKN